MAENRLESREDIEKWLKEMPRSEQKLLYQQFCFSHFAIVFGTDRFRESRSSDLLRHLRTICDIDPEAAAEWEEDARAQYDLVRHLLTVLTTA